MSYRGLVKVWEQCWGCRQFDVSVRGRARNQQVQFLPSFLAAILHLSVLSFMAVRMADCRDWDSSVHGAGLPGAALDSLDATLHQGETLQG